ncbi:hypothetical protein CCACVL1_28133 [Corchorus capsularis]|uniref:Uncharacterized protein n=1 Tax=Corchorus capsularis TaxID=210143 RepID=A0A1R3G7I0_COCAP|nr:hypothetical protein CCACVL1_28133 [Corchorus capsularis]
MAAGQRKYALVIAVQLVSHIRIAVQEQREDIEVPLTTCFM